MLISDHVQRVFFGAGEMPVLHKYTGKKCYYVLTSIMGNIITYELTEEVQSKLLAA